MSITDVIAEMQRLLAEGLITDYAIGGAVAAQAYVEVAATEDIDVFIVVTEPTASSLVPLGAVWASLVSHGAKQDGLYLVIGGWPVQLLVPGNALYEAAIREAVSMKLDDTTARVMTPPYLAAIALQTGRAKDYQRVHEFLRRGRLTRDQLTQLVASFHLDAAWKTFETRYPSSDDDR